MLIIKKNAGCLIAIVCWIIAVIIAFNGLGFVAMTDRPNPTMFWVCISFGILLFIIGIAFLPFSIKNGEPTKSDEELNKEPIDYKITNCPKCGSSSITEESISKGKWKRICSKCQYKWIAVEKELL